MKLVVLMSTFNGERYIREQLDSLLRQSLKPDLIYIRDLLGHVSVKTTEIYAKADAKLKREAIEAASKEIVPREESQWDNNNNLKSWLKDFNRNR